MATFNFKVDTEPMAKEIDSVSHHVNATTGAVVAMQAAVIAAEKDAADNVCANVNTGFYTLIRSQISQKIAKLQSDVDSHIMQLTQQKNSLLAIRGRMERDYHMISGRYNKLFNGLNSNLKLRIFELDKPTVNFASKEVDRIANRSRLLVSTVPVVQTESVVGSQKILSSNLKSKGAEVIAVMKSYLDQLQQQKNLNSRVFIKDSRLERAAKFYIPVIIAENQTEGGTISEIFTENENLNPASSSAMKNSVSAQLANLHWEESGNPDAKTTSAFMKMVTSSAISEREKKVMTELYNKANFLTLKSGNNEL